MAQSSPDPGCGQISESTALAMAVVLGVAGSVVAAYYPSRLASGVSIVHALQFE